MRAMAVRAIQVRRLAPSAPGLMGMVTPGEVELCLRRLAAQTPESGEPTRVEIALQFGDNVGFADELLLHRGDAIAEQPLLGGPVRMWAARELVDGNGARAAYLTRWNELLEHIVHQLLLAERGGVDESPREDDAERVHRRALPPPAPLKGPRYRSGRTLSEIERAVRRDLGAAATDGTLPAGLLSTVRAAGGGLEIEVTKAPRVWLPDLCEVCLPRAYGLGAAAPSGPPSCGHTPTLGGESLEATGLLLTVFALADVYNCDESGFDEGDQLRVAMGFDLAVCFDPGLARAQRERLQTSTDYLRELAREQRDVQRCGILYSQGELPRPAP